MKKILILGAPVFQIPIIETAKRMGIFVGIVDISSSAAAIQYADDFFQCSLKDFEGLYKIAERFHPDGVVIGACDTSVVAAAHICEKYGLPGHSLDTAIRATNKLEMLMAFERHNVAHPKFQIVNRKNIDSFKMDIPYPAISKPVDSSGSRGIYYIDNETQLKDALHYSLMSSQSGDVLVEEYMSGPEVSVEVIVIEGVPHVLQITDKITSGQPYFFETGHSQPSSLPNDIKNKIRDLAKQACIAVGIQNSPAHVEIKITENGPKMVELGARMGGDCISTYLLNTSVKGISLTEATIRMALGEKINHISYEDSGKAVAVRFILAQEGTILSITGIDDALKTKGAIYVHLTGKVGQNYAQTADNASRIGYVVAEAKTTKEALAICEEGINKIVIKYKEVEVE